MHVRMHHLHCVVTTSADPESVMQAFKAYSTRSLNRSGLESRDRKRWTRHGSTRKLWTFAAVEAAIRYVIHEQGHPMAVFVDRSAVVKPESKLETAGKKQADCEQSTG